MIHDTIFATVLLKQYFRVTLLNYFSMIQMVVRKSIKSICKPKGMS